MNFVPPISFHNLTCSMYYCNHDHFTVIVKKVSQKNMNLLNCSNTCSVADLYNIRTKNTEWCLYIFINNIGIRKLSLH